MIYAARAEHLGDPDAVLVVVTDRVPQDKAPSRLRCMGQSRGTAGRIEN